MTFVSRYSRAGGGPAKTRSVAGTLSGPVVAVGQELGGWQRTLQRERAGQLAPARGARLRGPGVVLHRRHQPLLDNACHSASLPPAAPERSTLRIPRAGPGSKARYAAAAGSWTRPQAPSSTAARTTLASDSAPSVQNTAVTSATTSSRPIAPGASDLATCCTTRSSDTTPARTSAGAFCVSRLFWSGEIRPLPRPYTNRLSPTSRV